MMVGDGLFLCRAQLQHLLLAQLRQFLAEGGDASGALLRLLTFEIGHGHSLANDCPQPSRPS